MNIELQKLFSTIYDPIVLENEVKGGSSIKETAQLRQDLKKLFDEYKIKKIFDAGCNEARWQILIDENVQYQGGDISSTLIDHLKSKLPDLNVCLHDITTDPIPDVDLLLVRDVAIHLNNHDKKLLWNNWIQSTVPWILITHNKEINENKDCVYNLENFPEAFCNWELPPWNFPKPLALIGDGGNTDGKCMGLWNKTQFINPIG